MEQKWQRFRHFKCLNMATFQSLETSEILEFQTLHKLKYFKRFYVPVFWTIHSSHICDWISVVFICSVLVDQDSLIFFRFINLSYCYHILMCNIIYSELFFLSVFSHFYALIVCYILWIRRSVRCFWSELHCY